MGGDSIYITKITDNDKHIFEITSDDVSLNLYGLQLTGAYESVIIENDYQVTNYTFKKMILNANPGAFLPESYAQTMLIDSCQFFRNGLANFSHPIINCYFIPESVVTNSYFEKILL